MQIHRTTFDQLPALSGRRAFTLGTFDGVHLGHRAILDACRNEAAAHGLDEAAAVTFAHHPRSVLADRRSPRILTTLEERVAWLAASGLSRLFVLDFDESLAAVEYDEFVTALQDKLGLAHFVLGHDVHFGRERRGNFETVAELAEARGFGISQVASVRHGDAPISSTRIRDCIAAADLDEAVQMLGHAFGLSGVVIEGRKLGRQIGIPTANLEVTDPLKLLPPLGVFAAYARWEEGPGWLPSVVNIGTAPTVSDDDQIRPEVHILDGAWELYGRLLEVQLASYLRAEQRFGGVEVLVAQIGADCDQARRLLTNPPAPSPFPGPVKTTADHA